MLTFLGFRSNHLEVSLNLDKIDKGKRCHLKLKARSLQLLLYIYTMITTEVFGERFQLFPEKAIHIPSIKTLLIADLHFGKINHFRKSGIPVPPKANDKNTEALIDLLNRANPTRTIFLGDLFHSYYNEEWNVVGQVLNHFPACHFELVRGNHDIMSKRQYERHNILVHEEGLLLGKFFLTHEPAELSNPQLYNLAGHIHPGVTLSGKGRQVMTLPCFYFGKNNGILPAFGSFTGLAKVSPQKKDQIFVVAEGSVIEVGRED
jgi:DNA ligase-associated metallophosphoesterase